MIDRELWIHLKHGEIAMNRLFIILLTICSAFFASAAYADLIYVSQPLNNTIMKFDSNSGIGSVFADASAGVDTVTGLAFDSGGNLFIANSGVNDILKIDSSGHSTVFANVLNPYGMAFDSSGNLYVGTRTPDKIYKFDSNGNGSVFASTGLNLPGGLAFDNAGNLYVANNGSNQITKFDMLGNSTVFATAGLNYPSGLAFDKNGNLYVTNGNLNNIIEFDPSGSGTLFASSDLAAPAGLVFDSSGNLYAANDLNASPSIARFDSSGNGTYFATFSRVVDSPIFMAVAPVPVPEPGTCTMMLAGLLLLGFAVRRKKEDNFAVAA